MLLTSHSRVASRPTALRVSRRFALLVCVRVETYVTISCFNHFTPCSSVAFGTITVLYSHQLLLQNTSSPRKETPHPLSHAARPHPAPGSHSSSFCLYGLDRLDISYQWDHTVGGLWCPASPSIMFFRVPAPHCIVACQRSVPFCGRVTPRCVDGPRFVYPFASGVYVPLLRSHCLLESAFPPGAAALTAPEYLLGVEKPFSFP